MATIQGGPLTTRPGDYNQRTSTPDRGCPQLAGKFALGRMALDGLYFRRDEAHLPAQETQAGPCSRVSWPHAHTRGTPDAEAPPRQGTQAPLNLTLAAR